MIWSSDAALLQLAYGRRVACGHGNHHAAATAGSAPRETALRFRIAKGTSSSSSGIGGQPVTGEPSAVRCDLEQCSPVAGAGLVQKRIDAIQQGGKITSAARQPDQITAGYSSKSQIQQGARQRLRKPRRLGDRREILQRVIAARPRTPPASQPLRAPAQSWEPAREQPVP